VTKRFGEVIITDAAEEHDIIRNLRAVVKSVRTNSRADRRGRWVELTVVETPDTSVLAGIGWLAGIVFTGHDLRSELQLAGPPGFPACAHTPCGKGGASEGIRSERACRAVKVHRQFAISMISA
jgi:hypothetical protein